jgi:nucleoside-diphosphate kinase
MERTFCMIKPDAVKRDLVSKIYNYIDDSGLKIFYAIPTWLTGESAEFLYEEHKARANFQELIDFTTSGPVMLLGIQGENAIAKMREVIGATDPKKRKPGTIRGDLAEGKLMENCMHSSDGQEAARRELDYFVYDGR